MENEEEKSKVTYAREVGTPIALAGVKCTQYN